VYVTGFLAASVRGQVTAPNNLPTATVIAMAAAPQNMIRAVLTKIFAPPA
jgi:hypothetical protein